MSITTFSSALVEITYFKFVVLFHDVMFQNYKTCFDIGMQVSAKVDYGVRALLFLAEAHIADAEKLVKGEAIATAQSIPLKFLEGILTELRHAGFILSQRGAVGGYRLSRSADKISLAEIIRVLDGPLAAVRGLRPENVSYEGSAEHLQDVWVGIRVALRGILENVSLADVVTDNFGSELSGLLLQPDAWVSRPGYETN
jgi:Rrf2 family protein